MSTTIANQEQPSGSASVDSSKERGEILTKALNIMGQGKRNFICGDVPMAVSQFEECCQILAETFGEMAFECAPAYFSYGHALLEMARMDSKVIESLEAEAAEDEDEDDESEKSEGKSGGETPGTIEDDDRTDKSESLSSQDEATDKEVKADGEGESKETKPDAEPKADTKTDVESKSDKEPSEEKADKKDEAKDEDSEDDEHNAGTDVTNLQLAWESLELAKVIYLRKTDKESQLKAAQACLKLGEVGLETGVYDQAVEDIKQCLKIQQQNLEPEEREIAESYYQLGLVHVFAGHHDFSIENFQKAVTVIEARMDKLNKIIESKKESKVADDIDAVYNAQVEIKELQEVIPDMKQKITDTIEEKKTVAELKLMAKKEAEEKLSEGPLPGPSGFDAMSRMSGLPASLGTTSTGFGSADAGKAQHVKTTDISHLIRRKRKPEAAEESTEKKQKSESGSCTSSESAKTKETDTSNGPLSSTQHTKDEPLSETKTN